MKFAKSQNGITLVEAVVAGALSAIVLGAAYTLFVLFGDSVEAGVMNHGMQMRAELVAEEIGRQVRKANLVLGPGESWAADPDLPPIAVDNIALCDESGNSFVQYRVAGPFLQEWNAGTMQWERFRAGKDPVELAPGSRFRLAGDRKSVTADIHIASARNGKGYRLQSKTEIFRCRN